MSVTGEGGSPPPVLSADEFVARLLAVPRHGESNMLAYYEHRLGAIVREPRLMLMPLDDHLAHRGDGIFETIKYSSGRLYRLDQHLDRMRRAAESLYLEPPCSWQELRGLIHDVAAAGREPCGMMRVLLGRGPGGFGVDPAECPEASLYIAAYRLTRMPESWYRAGLTGFRTTVPAKQGPFAWIKDVNYLPNALMVREAGERGKQVPFSFTEEGFLADSAVAGLCLVDTRGVLLVPVAGTLPSTTICRALELLEDRVPHEHRRITEQDIFAASEVLMLGTGPDCAAIVEYEGQSIGSGEEGPVCALLRERIHADILANGEPVPSLPQG